MKGISPAEVLALLIDAVEGHVFPGPVQIGLGEIQSCGGGTCQRSTDGEGAGVGKGIENGITGLAALPDPQAIFPLVEEDALRISGLETDEIANAVLLDFERLSQGFSCHKGRGFPGLLVEMFPVGRD